MFPWIVVICSIQGNIAAVPELENAATQAARPMATEGGRERSIPYSHSMVPGGFDVMS